MEGRNVNRCGLCNEPCERRFCSDFVACNWRCRVALGAPRFVANQWKGRDRWRYTRAQGGER